MAESNNRKLNVTTEFMSMPLGTFKRPTPSYTQSKQPACIRFVLGDGRSIDAAARVFIMLGRTEADHNTDPIDVDFADFGGIEYGVSREHAVVQVMRSQVLIKDFGSRNGTYINGQELYTMREYPLADGDTITLGRLQLCVQFIY